MRTKIDSHINFNGLRVRVDQYLALWATMHYREIKILPFKRDLRYWNNGNTSLQPKKVMACMEWDRHSDENTCVGVYEFWERQDGFSMEVYKFNTMEDYNNYNPSQESPTAFAKEIGVCSNYHKGI